MKNLLNCHTIGLHSFPVSEKDGLYERIFITDTNHHLWKPFEIAIHPHRVDLKITVLEGVLTNIIYEVSDKGLTLHKFKWNSHILHGSGGFELLGKEKLKIKSFKALRPKDSITMQACELHTVYVPLGEVCAWKIEESKPSCEYDPVNYSLYDLTKWRPDGLYIEVVDEVKECYIGKYL
jgi:hypothetical protein